MLCLYLFLLLPRYKKDHGRFNRITMQRQKRVGFWLSMPEGGNGLDETQETEAESQQGKGVVS